MSTEPERLDTSEPDDVCSEKRLIEEARRDVCEAFPWLPVDQVSAVVECIWAEFDGALIRDFVPVLVRKQAHEELRDHFAREPIDTTRSRSVAGSSAKNGATDREISMTSTLDARSRGTRHGGPFGRTGPQGLLGSPADG